MPETTGVHERHKIINSVVSPLGFYALALLIVEAFLLTAGTFFNLPEAQRVALVWTAIGILVLIVAFVGYLVIKHPTKLVFTDEAHLRSQIIEYGIDNKGLGDQWPEQIRIVPQPLQIPRQPDVLAIEPPEEGTHKIE